MAWYDGYISHISFGEYRGAGINYQIYSNGTVDVWVNAARANNGYTSSGYATTTVRVYSAAQGSSGGQVLSQDRYPYSVTNPTGTQVFAKNFNNQGNNIYKSRL